MDEHWQIFTALSFIVICLGAIILWALKFFFAKLKTDLEKGNKETTEKLEKIDGIEKNNRKLEREFLEMRADLPLNYIRKEDFIRHEVVINTKLDRLRDSFEKFRREDVWKLILKKLEEKN